MKVFRRGHCRCHLRVVEKRATEQRPAAALVALWVSWKVCCGIFWAVAVTRPAAKFPNRRGNSARLAQVLNEQIDIALAFVEHGADFSALGQQQIDAFDKDIEHPVAAGFV